MAWLSTDRQWRVLRDNARRMRKKPTPAEAKLWEALRVGKLGVNFRRQHGIGP
jgi:very-short-patch-repair endonuclease